MREIIPVDEKTRIRRVDTMNWTVEVMKETEKDDGAITTRWDQANGRGSGPFAGSPDSPVIAGWLLENAPELDGFVGTMKEHAKVLDRASRRIADSIARFASGERGIDGEIADVDIDGEVLD